MKKLSFKMLILMLIGVLAFTGCSKDLCEGVACQNGGTCVTDRGICDCPEGYSGEFCEIPPDNLKFLGTYSVSESFTSDKCGTGTDTYTMTIMKGNTDTKIIISNLLNLFDNINATVSGNNLTISNKLSVTDNKGSLTTWDINSGSGSISGSTLTFTTNIDDISFANACGNVNSTVTATK